MISTQASTFKMKNPILYLALAILATIVNLLTQKLTSQIFANSYELAISMFTGTLAGLVVKYIFNYTASTRNKDLSIGYITKYHLDKKYVFVEC